MHTSLRVSEPGDAAEREANRMAESVMHMAGNRATAPAASAHAVAPERVHRAAATGAPSGVSADVAAALPGDGLRTPGVALDTDTRAFMEPRFGRDLSGVRIHAGDAAAASARQVHALAYSIGNHIVFGAGQYAPATSSGRRLLAHEIAHTLQHADGAPPLIARQPSDPWIPIPEFDELDPCIIVPDGLPSPFDILGGQQVCGSTARKVIDFLRGRSGGSAASVQCPSGWRAATSRDFRGQCCRGGIDNAQSCCTPDRISPYENRCCAPGEVVHNNRCVSSTDLPQVVPLCPPERLTPSGECCIPPMVAGISGCEFPAAPMPETPQTHQTPAPAPAPLPSPAEIFFRFDRPALSETGGAALARAATGEGMTNFQRLVSDLRADPTLRVQLVGRASAEGPEEYNLDLAARRARLVAQALIDAGIGEDRIADPPQAELRAECQSFDDGIVSCGEAGATDASDRQVLARVFRNP
jgi:hypothetical protein